MTPPLVILDSSVFGLEIADVARQAGHEVAAFGENEDRGRCATNMDGLPVVWVDELEPWARTHHALCPIGVTPLRRSFIRQVDGFGFRFASVRHPSSVVSPTARLGQGGVVGAGAVIAAHARIGDHAVVNRGALVGHHARLADYVTLSPGANLAGGVRVGEGAYVGMGAVILDGLAVGRHSVVGAGAVVTRDVPERVQVLGVPARVVKRA